MVQNKETGLSGNIWERIKLKNKMKKICYIVTVSMTIEAFFIPQLQYLSAHGYDVTVVCSYDKLLQEKLGNGIKYVPIEIPRGISVKGSLSAIKNLTDFLKKEKFDLVQYSTPNAAFYASIAAKKAKIKCRNYHLMGFRYLGASGIGRILLKEIEKITCKNSTSIECVSKSNLALGVKNGIFPESKAVVVWNGSSGGVDLKKFDYGCRRNYRKEIRGRYQIAGDVFVYGFVGRITKDKGMNEILGAFSKIKDAVLLLVGDLENKDSLNQELYLNSLENQNIIYTGSVMEVEKYYAAMDVLLLPSYREGFGNVVIEAAAMGTPSIVSNIPGPVDAIVDGQTAFMVESKSKEDLLAAMQKMRNGDYTGMGQNACEYVRSHFDSERLCAEILRRKELLLDKRKDG